MNRGDARNRKGRADRNDAASRQRVFRRMEWVYVWLPPALAVLVAGAASLAIAALVPLPNTTFWGRWGLAMLVVLVAPAAVYLVRHLLNR